MRESDENLICRRPTAPDRQASSLIGNCAMNDFTSARLPEDAAPGLIRSADSYPVLDAETQSFVDHAAEAGVPAERLREWANGDATDAIHAEEIALTAGAADPGFTIRIVRPPQAAPTPLPAVLFLPDGASFAGGQSDNRLARRIATDAEAAVVLVDYTSAPAACFQTQNEQAFAALVHLQEHARALNLDGGALIVAGEGTGGHLVATLALLVKARRGPRIALQIMLCPTLSASTAGASAARYAGGPSLTTQTTGMRARTRFPSDNLGETIAMPLNASYTDLEDLPPALIVTAENDVARDDGEAYARKLMLAGVRVSAVRCLGTIHDFTVLDGLADTPPAEAALRLACGTIRATLRGH
ncbi:alpha/beta hydrolase fold domain-containing protein [Burkholderia sp. MS389]|nr:lipase [Burkholderia sp. AU31280]QRR18464.1 alpha/beta hydrolase fold domain-containing protein [Burkholderia sp. MS389]